MTDNARHNRAEPDHFRGLCPFGYDALTLRVPDSGMRPVQIRMSGAMQEAAERAAHASDITMGEYVRRLVDADLRRRFAPATTPNRVEEHLLSPLRVRLAHDFACATSWPDLNARLAAKGYALREAGGGLALHAHPEGTRLCKASELGHSYGALMRRYGAPFPGHAHRHLVDRWLKTTSPPPGCPDDGDDDDFDVIEEL